MIPRVVLCVSTALSVCTAASFDITIPQTGGNSNAAMPGIVTNAFKDGSLTPAALSGISPRLIRWPEGTTAAKLMFNPADPATMNVSIHDPSAWWFNYIGGDGSTWSCRPAFSFDKFISVCRGVNATPVALVGITAAYTSSTSPHASLQEVAQAARDWVTYANVSKGYKVAYWEIGNEDDIEGSTPQQYADAFNAVVPAMKSADPTIKCGANSMSGIGRWNQLLPLLNPKPDFLITHSYSWVNTYADWYSHEESWDWDAAGKDATTAINDNAGAPHELLITEISSFVPGNETDGNTTWKGLHNMQLQLEALSRPYTRGVTCWVSRWSDAALASSYNLFDASYNMTPMGYSCMFGRHVYPNLGAKVASGLVTLWVSHTTDLKKMSLFVLNRGTTAETVPITIRGFKGPWAHEKWVYTGSSATSTDAKFVKGTPENVTSGSFSLDIPGLSMTILDFAPAATSVAGHAGRSVIDRIGRAPRSGASRPCIQYGHADRGMRAYDLTGKTGVPGRSPDAGVYVIGADARTNITSRSGAD